MDDYVYDDKTSEEIAQRIRGMSDKEFEINCREELKIDFRGGRTPIPVQFIEEEKKNHKIVT